MVRVLFVCLGNICRSPLAEGVFRKLVLEQGLGGQIEVGSAGTGGWHVGDPPDDRMRRTARRNGVNLDDLAARKVTSDDLEAFDYVFAMDRQNLRDIKRLAGNAETPHIHLFRSFDPAGGDDVPDPYYGGVDGFERVYEIVDRTARAILEHIREDIKEKA